MKDRTKALYVVTTPERHARVVQDAKARRVTMTELIEAALDAYMSTERPLTLLERIAKLEAEVAVLRARTES